MNSADEIGIHRRMSQRALPAAGISLLMLLSGLVNGPARANDPPEPPSHLSDSERSLFVKADFQPVRKVKDLPAAVLALIGIPNAEAMADPGQPYEAGCTVGDLPRRRLIFAGLSSDRCLVFYEQGGRGHHFVVYVFDLKVKPAKVLARASTTENYANMEKLKDAAGKKIIL